MSSEPLTLAEQKLLAAEREVERHSNELRKELRLVDLVGIQILTIVGLSWIGTAAKIGASHIMFWLPAVLLFYVPSGLVVAHLAKEMPLEGGMYQWARLRFGPMAGFLVAMNIWLYNVLIASSVGIQVIGTAPYWLDKRGAAIANNKSAILFLSLIVALILMFVAWRGLSLGKWISNFGGFVIVALFAAIVFVAIPRWIHGTSPYTPFALSFPAASLLNLNLLGKMGFAAMSGVDSVAVFAGECRSKNPGEAIRRSVWIGAFIIAVMMVLGTGSIVTFVRPDSVDLIMPQVQVLSLAVPQVAKFASVIVVLMLLAGGCLCFSVLSRFPMVAGWDHLLPPWFSRLDPRYRTPVGSILFAGVVMMGFIVVANLGAGNQEAYQFMLNAALVCYACAYSVMFAIPLVARGEKPSFGIRFAALSGLGMTLLFVVLSIFPIVEEQNPGLFTLKMIAIISCLQGAGVLFYRRAARRLTATAVAD